MTSPGWSAKETLAWTDRFVPRSILSGSVEDARRARFLILTIALVSPLCVASGTMLAGRKLDSNAHDVQPIERRTL